MKNNKTDLHRRGVLRAAAIHDLSCFGRCALTVVIPTLSAMGIQTVPLPTALLSTHTGGFDGLYFRELTDEMRGIENHFGNLELDFDAIYTGFLGSAEQICVVSDFIDRFGDKALCFIDPVMGDDGVLYSTYNDTLVAGTRTLCAKADIITPNITEAFLLAREEYRPTEAMSEDSAAALARELCRKISAFTDAAVVITGIHHSGDRVATFVLDNAAAVGTMHSSRRVGRDYPGTGDLFASVMLGRLLGGDALDTAAVRASEFTRDAIEYSMNFDTPVREGVTFEPLLASLGPKNHFAL